MKKEIRGLEAGDYWSDDDSLLFRVRRNDNGVVVEIADLDADIFYAVTIDEKAKAKFELGSISPLPTEERGTEDAAD